MSFPAVVAVGKSDGPVRGQANEVGFESFTSM